MVGIISFIGNTLTEAIDIYRIILVVYFLTSWIPGARQSRLGEIMSKICEPYLQIFRQFIPPIGMFSVASIVAYFALSLIKEGVAVITVALIRFLAVL